MHFNAWAFLNHGRPQGRQAHNAAARLITSIRSLRSASFHREANFPGDIPTEMSWIIGFVSICSRLRCCLVHLKVSDAHVNSASRVSTTVGQIANMIPRKMGGNHRADPSR